MFAPKTKFPSFGDALAFPSTIMGNYSFSAILKMLAPTTKLPSLGAALPFPEDNVTQTIAFLRIRDNCPYRQFGENSLRDNLPKKIRQIVPESIFGKLGFLT